MVMKPDPDTLPEADPAKVAAYEAHHGEDTYDGELGCVVTCSFCGAPRTFSDVEDNCCPGRAEQERYEARHP